MDNDDIGLRRLSEVDEPVYEPDMKQFIVSIKYKDKETSKVFQYDANLDEPSVSNNVMVSIVGDMIADSLEDMLEDITK